MTSYLKLLLFVRFTTRSLLKKLAKLSISNTNISSSSYLAISYNKIKLKDNIHIEFFYRKQARLRAYLI